MYLWNGGVSSPIDNSLDRLEPTFKSRLELAPFQCMHEDY